MKCTQIVFDSKEHAVLREFKVPEPKPDEVVAEADYSVISAGTELANFRGLSNTSGTFPFAPGYSAAGRIIKKGKLAKDLKVGDRVLMPWGGHVSHMLRKTDMFPKIAGDRVDLLEAAFAVIASFSFLGVRKLRLDLGESVMIVGQGILGVLALQIASLSGAMPLLVSDFDPKRRKLALKLGADYAFDPADPEFVDNIKNVTDGKGVNGIVEVTGFAQALQTALEYAAWQGRITLLGCTRVSDAPIDFYKYVHRPGVSLIGAHTSTRPAKDSRPGEWTHEDDFATFLKFVAAKRIRVKPLISKIVSPAGAPEVYSELAEAKQPPLGVVFDWSRIR